MGRPANARASFIASAPKQCGVSPYLFLREKKTTYSKYHNCVKEMKVILSVLVDPYPATIGLESIWWEKLYSDKLKTKFKVLGLCRKNSNMAHFYLTFFIDLS